MKVLVAIYMKEHRLGFPKIGRDLRIDLRGLRYGARKVEYFRHFETKSGNRITDQPCSALWLFTRLHMCLSGLELCLRVGTKFS